MKAAHVPDTVAFATKPALASMMIDRAIDGGVPFAWVAADSVYGVGDADKALRRAGRGYVPGVNSNHWFGDWNTTPLIAGEAKDIAKDLPADVARQSG
jgi:SRSO17 transposase